MSRFCFCNCPAGFSAEPERHAPDCPGRSGAGKARTPVPATTPAPTANATEELAAVLHWRSKHAVAIKERDALQQRLTAADERADVLEGFLRDINDAPGGSQFKKHIDAALNPAPGEPDRINGMIETVGGEYAVMIDRANSHYGWTFKKHPDGQWVSGRKATEREMIAARSHAQNTKQLQPLPLQSQPL